MSEGLTANGIERLRAVVAEHVADDRIPGLVALVSKGDQVHVEAQGSLSIGGAPENPTPPPVHTAIQEAAYQALA